MLNRMKLRTGLMLVLGLLTLALWLAAGMAWQGARSASRATAALIELSDRHIQPLHDTERLFLKTLHGLEPGDFRSLTPREVKELKGLAKREGREGREGRDIRGGRNDDGGANDE